MMTTTPSPPCFPIRSSSRSVGSATRAGATSRITGVARRGARRRTLALGLRRLTRRTVPFLPLRARARFDPLALRSLGARERIEQGPWIGDPGARHAGSSSPPRGTPRARARDRDRQTLGVRTLARRRDLDVSIYSPAAAGRLTKGRGRSTASTRDRKRSRRAVAGVMPKPAALVRLTARARGRGWLWLERGGRRERARYWRSPATRRIDGFRCRRDPLSAFHPSRPGVVSERARRADAARSRSPSPPSPRAIRPASPRPYRLWQNAGGVPRRARHFGIRPGAPEERPLPGPLHLTVEGARGGHRAQPSRAARRNRRDGEAAWRKCTDPGMSMCAPVTQPQPTGRGCFERRRTF